jgi:hypothetical protein
MVYHDAYGPNRLWADYAYRQFNSKFNGYPTRTVLRCQLSKARPATPWPVPIQERCGRYGSWQTVHSRFRHWRDVKVREQVPTVLQTEATVDGTLEGVLAMSWPCLGHD